MCHALSNCSRYANSSLCFLTTVLTASLLLLTLLHEARSETVILAKNTKLEDLTLEELMNVEVYSASKQLETAFTTAAAVYVITQDEIHKSGAKTLTEALRLAPGVQVSCTSNNFCNVGIRGFTGPYSHKLLVLQDGRTLYDPLTSGVYWDIQQVMLDDIEQIEIIRGPAATLWGVNAVNGVINIKTRHARDSQGGLVTVSGGTTERAAVGVRYGGKTGENGWLRAYGKYFYREERLPDLSNTLTQQPWADWRGGFRGDWEINDKNSATLQGDVCDERFGNNRVNAGNLLGRWNKTLSDTSLLTLQLYYEHQAFDKTQLSMVDGAVKSYRDVWDRADLEIQQTFALGERQRLIWGTGFRIFSDRLNGDPSIVPYYISLFQLGGKIPIFQDVTRNGQFL